MLFWLYTESAGRVTADAPFATPAEFRAAMAASGSIEIDRLWCTPDEDGNLTRVKRERFAAKRGDVKRIEEVRLRERPPHGLPEFVLRQ